jgi:hypothetical protein
MHKDKDENEYGGHPRYPDSGDIIQGAVDWPPDITDRDNTEQKELDICGIEDVEEKNSISHFYSPHIVLHKGIHKKDAGRLRKRP